MRSWYFLTGATGLLGRELVPRLLLADPRARLTILLRSREGTDAASRFDELRSLVRERQPFLDLSRLDCVPGDLVRPGLGLDRHVWDGLRQGLTHVVHAAADIALNATLDQARRTNVAGTAETLRLAAAAPQLRRFAYVSTAFVAGDRTGAIYEDELDRGQGFLNAYERSKFEAERLVRSRAVGLPITVFRPSIIVGDSRDGRTCNFASIYLPLRWIGTGVIREIPGDPTTLLDLVPVDYVADAMTELIVRPRRRRACYHLVAGPRRSLSVQDLLDAAVARFDRPTGRPLRFLERSDATGWPRTDLSVFFDYMGSRKEFDDSRLRCDLQITGLRCPDPRAYLDTLLDYCEATDWGRRPATEDQPCVLPC